MNLKNGFLSANVDLKNLSGMEEDCVLCGQKTKEKPKNQDNIIFGAVRTVKK